MLVNPFLQPLTYRVYLPFTPKTIHPVLTPSGHDGPKRISQVQAAPRTPCLLYDPCLCQDHQEIPLLGLTCGKRHRGGLSGDAAITRGAHLETYQPHPHHHI